MNKPTEHQMSGMGTYPASHNYGVTTKLDKGLPEITECFVCGLPLPKLVAPGAECCRGNHYEMSDGSIVNVPEERMKEIRAAEEARRKASGD